MLMELFLEGVGVSASIVVVVVVVADNSIVVVVVVGSDHIAGPCIKVVKCPSTAIVRG